jgi:hypothetical protein
VGILAVVVNAAFALVPGTRQSGMSESGFSNWRWDTPVMSDCRCEAWSSVLWAMLLRRLSAGGYASSDCQVAARFCRHRPVRGLAGQEISESCVTRKLLVHGVSTKTNHAHQELRN